MTRKTIAGMDLSLTNTGLVALFPGSVEPYPHEVEIIVPKMPKPEKGKRARGGVDSPETADAKMRRLVHIRHAVRDFLAEFPPDIAVIEGYGFASQMAHSLGECGGMVKTLLWELGIDTYLVPPTVLKKFTAEDGTASKGMMLLDVWVKWGFRTKNDNVADAYACARVGDVLLNGSAKDRAAILSKITYVPGKGKR